MRPLSKVSAGATGVLFFGNWAAVYVKHLHKQSGVLSRVDGYTGIGFVAYRARMLQRLLQPKHKVDDYDSPYGVHGLQ